MSLDPDRPPEPMTGLPSDPAAMTTEIRRRLLAEWEPLLRESGLPVASARFWLSLDTTGGNGWRSELSVSFGSLPQSRWSGVEAAMARAAASNGWGAAGVSHGLNQRKGAFFLRGGCSVSGGCSYDISAPKVDARLTPLTDAEARRLPELDPYRLTSSPTG